MKNSRKEVESRREDLYSAIRENPMLRISELAERLGVSEPTVRRDLASLAEEKRIERFHGGARVSEHTPVDMVAERQTSFLKDSSREMIAKYAASLVEDGDTIFINTSSTAINILKYITARNVTVVTNNGHALDMSVSADITVILTGGEMNRGKCSLTGEFALGNIRKVSAKKTFLGCSGITTENGMTTEILNEVELNQEMLRRTIGKAYILADHTKVGYDSSFVSCPLGKISNIITDDEADRGILLDFQNCGIEVTVVRGKEGKKEVS